MRLFCRLGINEIFKQFDIMLMKLFDHFFSDSEGGIEVFFVFDHSFHCDLNPAVQLVQTHNAMDLKRFNGMLEFIFLRKS